jgi:hypothetical protein
MELCLLRILQAASYADLAEMIKEEWGFELTRQSVGNFFRSDEGAELMEEAYATLRKEYSNEPVIEKSTRVMALREQAVKLQGLLRELPVSDPEWREYSQEFRQYIKQIATEMEGIQVNVTEGKSAVEVAMEAALAKQRKLELVK